ncbi:MAG: tRNA 2-thiouridine(34) synthase MnmA [Candidatus Saccharimonadales bacterium]
MKKVFVGMSGGVDSSVTAALLVAAGYDVTGVFMKNWARDLPGFKCPWREDLADAKRVAVQLGIPFKIYDFQDQYRYKVVDYMITEYKAGRTPNPDIMCNQEVKFKLFLETALEDGADLIATGHYARIGKNANSESSKPSQPQTTNYKLPTTNYQLQTAADQNKDQTYFLYRMTEDALSKTLFPLGEMTKPEVRKKAAELGLITAEKKDSVGICFVGEIGIKEFLKNFVSTEPGAIVEKSSRRVVGEHDGALYYTIGQRHGLNVGGGMPYYVVGKDMATNEVYVSTDLNDPDLWHQSITITDEHWINGLDLGSQIPDLRVRTRHRGLLTEVTRVEEQPDGGYELTLKDEIRALAPGQSAVLYQNEICLGGGIIV